MLEYTYIQCTILQYTTGLLPTVVRNYAQYSSICRLQSSTKAAALTSCFALLYPLIYIYSKPHSGYDSHPVHNSGQNYTITALMTPLTFETTAPKQVYRDGSNRNVQN